MTPIETITKEVNDVKVIGELFEQKIFNNGPDVFARVVFQNAENKHLIGTIYLQGVDSKEKLEEAVTGSVEKINDILPCL